MTETVLVLLVSLGASALRSAFALAIKLARPEPLREQTTAMNSSRAPDLPWLDLAYQLVDVGLGLVPALLALHLLLRDDSRAARAIGFDGRRPGSDLARGLLLAAAVGLPGLGWYLAARAIGINTTVAAANLESHWWSVPVLVLAAMQNAVLEEVVMVGYLFTRWGQAGWGVVVVILTSALIRGSYHLYQGVGGFAGNLVMGLLFGWVYTRTRRVMPLVIAHTVLDVVAFVGYALLRDQVGWLT